MKKQVLAPLLLLTLTSACANIDAMRAASDEERNAVCAAQLFLKTNGYLDVAASRDRSKLSLELWDGLTFSVNGKLDWDALLASRRGTYAGRLSGVKSVDGGHLVAYNIEESFSCVFVGTSKVHLIEANCRPEGNAFINVDEQSLSCPEAAE